MRGWRPPYKDLDSETQRRTRARSYANVYKGRGELIPEPCSRCGGTTNIEMHHEDYDEPLKIIWLCRVCHRELHQASA